MASDCEFVPPKSDGGGSGGRKQQGGGGAPNGAHTDGSRNFLAKRLARNETCLLPWVLPRELQRLQATQHAQEKASRM